MTLVLSKLLLRCPCSMGKFSSVFPCLVLQALKWEMATTLQTGLMALLTHVVPTE